MGVWLISLPHRATISGGRGGRTVQAQALEPPAISNYAFANKPELRLRFPLAFFNTGAKALIVTDLRVVFDDEPTPSPSRWITTRTKLRHEEHDGFAFATPFSVGGRSAKEVIAEFGDVRGWSLEPLSKYRLRLQAEIHPSEKRRRWGFTSRTGTSLTVFRRLSTAGAR